jgi:hypothetical protein
MADTTREGSGTELTLTGRFGERKYPSPIRLMTTEPLLENMDPNLLMRDFRGNINPKPMPQRGSTVHAILPIFTQRNGIGGSASCDRSADHGWKSGWDTRRSLEPKRTTRCLVLAAPKGSPAATKENVKSRADQI